MIAAIDGYRAFKRALAQADPNSFLCVIDFLYQHYALGDILTTEIDVAIMASEQGREHIDLVVALDPGRPAASLQGFITPLNYLMYLDNLYPAFLCMPKLRSLKLIRDRLTFSYTMLAKAVSKQPMWPSLQSHLRMAQSYPLGHKRINAFHERNGYVPKLTAPIGYDSWAKQFLKQQMPGRTIVVINPRQSALASVAAVVYRDAPLPEWYRFLRLVSERYPKVMFFMVGGFVEWENALQRLPNVYIPRAHGLTLGHELAILANADMFIGTSSGFATFATFSDIPYAIVNIEHFFANYAGVEPGAEHYPFGHADQLLTWERENCATLLDLFERILDAAALRRREASGEYPAPLLDQPSSRSKPPAANVVTTN